MRRKLVTMGVLALAAIAPAVSHGDDQKIAEMIVERLQVERTDGKLAGFNIKLEVDQGTVWIKGHVSEKRQQDLVLDIARRVPGVRQVVNDIEVACEVPTEIPVPKLRETPASDPVPLDIPVPGEAIGSGVEGLELPESSDIPTSQDAQAEGLIPTFAKEEPIQQTQGTSPAAPSDEWIGRTLVGKLEAMERQGVLHGCSLDLHVEGRSVFLEGTTSTAQQRSAVLDVARRIYGVKQVVNGLRIQSSVRQTSANQPMPVSNMPVAMGQRPVTPVNNVEYGGYGGGPVPMHDASMGGGAGVSYDHPNLPPYAWAATAANSNYAALQYPRQYSPSAWPYIGPFYPYPQVPLGWRKVSLEWDDGWWFLDFHSKR
ncbi:MAG: BON domain-containing protein [Planctomycetales bacterium]|nr:BON domain-containing protein [Planctomycetales bacterium]